jgi:hypothetical protein
MPPAPDQLAGLAGRYEVTLVNANGEYGASVVRGVLLLWPNVSASGFRGRWAHDPGFSVTVDSASGRVVGEPGGYFCARRAPGT